MNTINIVEKAIHSTQIVLQPLFEPGLSSSSSSFLLLNLYFHRYCWWWLVSLLFLCCRCYFSNFSFISFTRFIIIEVRYLISTRSLGVYVYVCVCVCVSGLCRAWIFTSFFLIQFLWLIVQKPHILSLCSTIIWISSCRCISTRKECCRRLEWNAQHSNLQPPHAGSHCFMTVVLKLLCALFHSSSLIRFLFFFFLFLVAYGEN